MSRKLLLLPPLAFARIGTSSEPVDWFLWGPNDDSLRGTGKTTVFRCTHLDQHGNPVADHSADSIVFRDQEKGIRPVCPYFELYEQTGDAPDAVRPVTPSKDSPVTVRWTVRLANMKAHYRTAAEGDKVLGTNSLEAGDDQMRRCVIQGTSPEKGEPLVPATDPVEMGTMEVSAPPLDKPYRLRFLPPKGLVYGPRDISSRAPNLKNVKATLNPSAAWCKWEGDDRQFLGRLSYFEDGTHAGLIDDTSDGFVLCELSDGRSATARLAITPPHFAPDRRYLVSVADGLKDRVERFNPSEADSPHWMVEAEHLVLDIMERVLESVSAMNLDALAERFETIENPNTAYDKDRPWFPGASDAFDFKKLREQSYEDLPLTEMGRRRHRQFISLELLKRFIRQRPTLLKEVLRPPVGENQFYNRQMPAFSADRMPDRFM